jgi:hypothetical protein
LLVVSILFYGFYNYLGVNSLIHWNILTSTEKLKIPIDTFTKGILSFSIEADTYLVFQQYIGGDFTIDIWASYLYFGIIILALLLALTTLSFLNNWLYYVGTAVVLGYFILQQPDVLFSDLSWSKFIQIAPILFIGGTGYYFFAINTRVKFAYRFFVFLISTGIYYGLLFQFSSINIPVLYLLNYGAIVLIIISLVFIFFVGYEIVYMFLNIITVNKTSGNQNGTIHFSIIFGLYMLNLILQYFKNTHILNLELIHINPFFILLVSATLGIWGFKDRSVMFFKLLPFYPFGAVVYVAWAMICFSTIGFYFAMGNDPLVEVFEDSILFTHIGFGIAFFLYVMGNYSRWFNSITPIRSQIYSNQWVSFLFVYGTGLLIVFTMFSYSNMFTWYQAQAGYYNGIADAYYYDGNKALAQEYYRKAVSHEFQNHKSNYSLATIYKNSGNQSEAIAFYKKANLKQPSVFAYANLSQLYVERGKTFEAIFALKKGIEEFPESGELQNNLGLLYKDINFIDSAVIYFSTSAKLLKEENAAAVNKLGTYVKNNVKIDKIEKIEYLPYEINRLAHDKLFEIDRQADLIATDTVLNDLSYAYITNYDLYHLKNEDTLQLIQLSKLQKPDTNNFYRSDIDYLKALINYYNGSVSVAMKSIDNLQLGDQYAAGTYLNTIGLWTLDNDVPRFAVDIFQLAYDKGCKTSLINKAIALMECGMQKEAINIFASGEIQNDPGALAVSEQIGKAFAFKDINAILIADDGDKYVALHYRMKSFSDDQLGNLFFSFIDRTYQFKAGCDIFDYYYKQHNLARCGEILSELREKQKEVSTQLSLRMMKYFAAIEKWNELKEALNTLKLDTKGITYKAYFEAKLAEYEGANASEKYTTVCKRFPFDENVLIDASKYFQEKQNNSFTAFNILLEGISLNPYSSALYKAYCLQAINYGIPGFADNGLVKLRELVSDKEYKEFSLKLDKHKKDFHESLFGN